jgi:UDP-N-acetylmuramoyl-L-alanyl-D-glutamate--2,6-diaminopimelate ligase
MPQQEATGTIDRHAMPLRDLLARAVDPPGAGITGTDRDVCIRQVTDDSRTVTPGACFVAVQGTHADGAGFVADAVARGAVAVVTDRECAVPPTVAHVRVLDARRAMARLAAVQLGLADLNWSAVSAEPRLRVIGITGTNGKSTSCFLARAILRAAGEPTALLGTIQYDLLSRQIDAPMTTPPARQLVQYLMTAADAGATHAVMETSSHALDQRRTDGIRFDAGVFTNLTGDHMDYHKTREAYRLAKRRLFDLLDADATGIVNADDPAGDSMLEACRGRHVRFGLSPRADLYACIKTIDATGSRFYLVSDGQRVPIQLKLVGRHNVQNALAAAAAARAVGVDWAHIVDGLESVESVRGRLEPVHPPAGEETGFTVLVDYAHTDDALDNVLGALRPIAPHKLIVMFGCGGDRDRLKRPRMASVAERWADRIVVTSDNPRSERPADIIEEILTGFSEGARGKVLVQSDRRRAIHEAIAQAGPGDVVLLAGKGHEAYQDFGDHRIHFDDAEVAAEAMTRRRVGGSAA